MIDLKYPKRNSNPKQIEGPEYPSLYLSDIKLPLSKDDVGKEMTAIVKIKTYRIQEDNSTIENHVSFDFAIKAIEFKNSVEDNVKKNMDKVFKKGK